MDNRINTSYTSIPHFSSRALPNPYACIKLPPLISKSKKKTGVLALPSIAHIFAAISLANTNLNSAFVLNTPLAYHRDDPAISAIITDSIITNNIHRNIFFAHLIGLPNSSRKSAIFNERIPYTFYNGEWCTATKEDAHLFTTPLLAAIGINNLATAQLLLENGADPNRGNQTNSRTLFPLLYAAIKGNVEMIQLLMEHGACITSTDFSNRDILTSTKLNAGKPKTISKLISLGLNNEYSDDLIAKIELAQIWGIPDSENVSDINSHVEKKPYYNGIPSAYSPKMAKDYLGRFLQKIDTRKDLTDSQKTDLLDLLQALDEIIDRDTILERLDNGIPTIIFGGFYGHTVTSVIFYDTINGNEKNYLAICNRGACQPENMCSAVKYHLPLEKCTITLIDSLSNIYPNEKSFHEATSNLPFDHMEYHFQKPQTSNNCGWTSFEAAMFVLFCSILGKDKGKVMYKEFTSFAREESLSRYLKRDHTVIPLDQELLSAVAEKQKKRPQKPM